MRLKRIENRWYIYGFISIVFAITQIKPVMYLIFLLQIYYLLRANKCSQEKIKLEQLNLIIVSLFLPDNYVIIFVAFMFLIFTKQKRQYKISEKNAFWMVIIGTYILINVSMNLVPLKNIMMSAIYMLPFFVLGYEIKNMLVSDKIRDGVISALKYWIVIEGLSIVIYASTHLGIVQSYADMDWVTGTLGLYQCNVLMCICSFSFLIFWAQISYDRKKDYKLLIFSGLIALSTGAVAYTIFFALSLTIVVLVSSKVKARQKLGIISLVVLGCVAFVFLVPKWMSKEILRLLDMNYIYNRITKLRFYVNTFVEIPMKEGITDFLIGTGLGQYSSRAAETCAGGYVGLYDKFFKSYEAMIRVKYISGPNYGGDGLTSSSQASIISLQGELGFIGLITFLSFLLLKLRKANDPRAKTVILYFTLLMFLDNIIEFAKYGAIFWIAYYACIGFEKKDYFILFKNGEIHE